MIGQSSRIVYPDDEEYENVGRQKYEQIGKKGTGSVNTKFKRKDGKIIDVVLSSTPLDPLDLSAGVTFSALDVTKRNAIGRGANQRRAQMEKYSGEHTPDWHYLESPG